MLGVWGLEAGTETGGSRERDGELRRAFYEQ